MRQEFELGTEGDFYTEAAKLIARRRTRLPGKVAFYDAVKRAELLLTLSVPDVTLTFWSHGADNETLDQGEEETVTELYPPTMA